MEDLKKVLKDTEKYALHLLLLARIRIPLWNLVTRIQGKEIPTGSCPGPATFPFSIPKEPRTALALPPFPFPSQRKFPRGAALALPPSPGAPQPPACAQPSLDPELGASAVARCSQ